MKIRIVNNGSPSHMTQIVDVDTGKQLLHVTRVDLTIDVKEPVFRAVLTTILPVVDIIADAEIKQVCPCCGKPTDEPPLQGVEQVE